MTGSGSWRDITEDISPPSWLSRKKAPFSVVVAANPYKVLVCGQPAKLLPHNSTGPMGCQPHEQGQLVAKKSLDSTQQLLGKLL